MQPNLKTSERIPVGGYYTFQMEDTRFEFGLCQQVKVCRQKCREKLREFSGVLTGINDWFLHRVEKYFRSLGLQQFHLTDFFLSYIRLLSTVWSNSGETSYIINNSWTHHLCLQIYKVLISFLISPSSIAQTLLSTFLHSLPKCELR